MTGGVGVSGVYWGAGRDYVLRARRGIGGIEKFLGGVGV